MSEDDRIDALLNARWPLDKALENFEFRYDAIEALLDALSAMRAERGEAREKLGECHAGYETLRKELAAAQAERDEAREAYARRARQSEEGRMTLEDHARALQLALAKGSWNESFELIAEALREERRAAFERAAEIVRDECSFELGEALVRCILSGDSEQDDSGLPTAEDVQGILK